MQTAKGFFADTFKNRCGVTGRPRGIGEKFNMSRIAFREYAHRGQISGVKKSSWQDSEI